MRDRHFHPDVRLPPPPNEGDIRHKVMHFRFDFGGAYLRYQVARSGFDFGFTDAFGHMAITLADPSKWRCKDKRFLTRQTALKFLLKDTFCQLMQVGLERVRFSGPLIC